MRQFYNIYIHNMAFNAIYLSQKQNIDVGMEYLQEIYGTTNKRSKKFIHSIVLCYT